MIRDDRSRSILTENVVADVDYRWTANVYRGCEFACAACYARGSHEYLDLNPDDDFDQVIVVKRDAAALLREAFDKPSWRGDTITFSAVSDPYQPIEQELGITRACLDVCAAYRNPVRIVTKSPLVLRDIDLLKAPGAHVDVTVTYLDAAAGLEPRAPSPDERLRAIEGLAAAGISVGVMVAPVIAGLTDREVPMILERAAQAGAKTATWALLRLPEPTASVFSLRLRRDLPAVASKVLSLASDSRGPEEPRDKPFHTRGVGGGAHVKAIEAMFEATARRLGLITRAFAKRDEPPTTFRRPTNQLALF
ncbi:MAG: hypothetical protein QM831_34590 [Kofleriaceae bacterium]